MAIPSTAVLTLRGISRCWAKIPTATMACRRAGSAILAGTTKRFQKPASKCMPMLGAVFTQKYSSARSSLEEALMGNKGRPLVGSGDRSALMMATWFLALLGGGKT
jgi:hypothetical protein